MVFRQKSAQRLQRLGQSKNVQEPARADVARGMAALETGVAAQVEMFGDQSINHILLILPLDVSPIHPWPLPYSDTHHIAPEHLPVFKPSPFCCKS